MQHPVRNFLILVLAITSTLFFSNISMAEGDTPPPASTPPTGDAPSPNAPMTNTTREPVQSGGVVETLPPVTADSTAPNSPAAVDPAPAPAQTHRPANVTAVQTAVKMENIIVTSARMKPSIAGNPNSAAFVSLHNSNKADLVIVGANVVTSDKPNASSVANRIELHNTVTDSEGVTKMVQVNKLVVPMDGDLTMASGGTHIMLFDMKKNLKEGDIVFVNLTIQGLGNYQVQLPVKSTD